MSPTFSDLAARLRGCRGALIDSNIVLDLATADPAWGEWSRHALAEIAEHAVLIVNPIIYAEVSVGFANIEELDAVLPAALYRRDPFLGKPRFWPGSAFCNTGATEASGGRRCQTSISGPTPPLSALGC
jgi:hypothetical protein